ncbi:MAG: KamA family radical SAM protein, partial [bacterium]
MAIERDGAPRVKVYLGRGIADRERAKIRLLKALDAAPEIRDILVSSAGVEQKRRLLRNYLMERLSATFEDDPSLHPLEWIQARDAIRVFRNLISTRSERLAGFSLLEYTHELLAGASAGDVRLPEPDFFDEIEHLLLGVTGRTGIYREKAPAFHHHAGRAAARLRSADLSRIARSSKKFMERYACGLDAEAVRRRRRNRRRILDYFGAGEAEWNDWKWQTRHIIRDAGTLRSLVYLGGEEYDAAALARRKDIPFGITPYYLSLMDNGPDRSRDYAVRAQVIPTLHYVRTLDRLRKGGEEHSMDFMLERDTSPLDGITRRYPMIAILKPFLTCPQVCVYCRRNWEITDVYSPHAALSGEKLERALDWIGETPEINEVLITGGDPLLMSNQKLES